MLGKWIAFAAVIAALTVVCAGCGSSGGEDSSSSTEQSSTGSSGNGEASQESVSQSGAEPKPLPVFKPGEVSSEKPNLPKVLAFVQDSPRGFEQLLATGLKEGAEDAGLEFEVAQSGGDVEKEVGALEQFLAQGVGALTAIGIEPEAQAPIMERAIGEGVAALGLSLGPATMEVAAEQHDIGERLAEVAAEYIETKLGGKANVVLLNEDSVELIRPRFEAMREVFAKMPGVKIVADVQPEETDSEHGFQTMSTILQKEPNVNVVLGADAVVLGALSALEAAHLDKPDQFLGGVDCEEEALTKIEEGGPYKACVSTAPAVFGYAMGRYAGDWLEGKCIPQGISILPLSVTSPSEVPKFREEQQDPAGVFNNPKRYAEYVGLYGNICYDSRENFLNYNWEAPSVAGEG